ncbi:TIGR02680 family protein [Alkalibacterium psychrotolerans]
MIKNENKWVINRAGLFNYWYYEDEVFDFAEGKLLLRGNNGAGKSVTMQSFLPVLLDGSTRPERLDPFGSRARRMEDYLLGEKEVTDLDERTGYLYMEFKREESDQYITIGIGLKARRGAQLNFWGFIVTDNRRIGKDFNLYNSEKHEGENVKIPLSKIQMRNQLNDGGQLVETRKEYASLVNQHIFGYETIEEYEDLIKLLIQLRSPKLSKDFRPTVIYDILEEALPPLSTEDLRHLSDTIEQMDQTKQQLEQLDREHEAISTLNKAYTNYNQKVLFDQASGFKRTTDSYQSEEETYTTRLTEKQALENRLTHLDKELANHEIEKAAADKQRQRLNQHKVWDLEKEYLEKTEELNQEVQRLKQAQLRLDTARKKEYDSRERLDTLDLKGQKQEEALTDLLADMADSADEASFLNSHELHSKDFTEQMSTAFAFEAWDRQADRHLSALEDVTDKLRELEILKDSFKVKDRELGEASHHLDDRQLEEQDWLDWLREEKNKQLNAIYNWVQDADYLSVPEETMQKISRAMSQLFKDSRYEDVREPVRESINRYESIKREEIANLQATITAQNKLLDELTLELNEWKNKKDPDPKTPDLSKEFRDELVRKGVSAVPLYSAVEFRPDIGEETQKRIEAALLDSGLLDALITNEDVDVLHDRILTPNPQMMAYTLADILKPDIDDSQGISDEHVDQILRSILIDESSRETLSISEKGYYSIGLMRGHALPVDTVRFIGKQARKRYRENQIIHLQDLIEKENNQLNVYQDKQDHLRKLIEEARFDFSKFPDDKDLAEGHKQLTLIQNTISQLTRQIEKLSEDVKAIGSDLHSKKQILIQETRSYNLELSLIAYQSAVKQMRQYEKDLGELKRVHGELKNIIVRQEELIVRLNELEEELISYKGDINVYKSSVQHLEKDIEYINQQIEQEGISDIRKQIKETQELIQKLESLISENRTEKASKAKEIEYVTKDIAKQEERIHFWEKLKEAWASSFSNEWAKSLHDFNETTNFSLGEKARVVLNNFHHLKDQDISNLIGRLSRVRNDQLDNLIEFSPSQRTDRLSIPEWMQPTLSNNEFDLLVKEWQRASQRDVIECLYLAKRVSPYTVEKELTTLRDRQKVYLDEQDKRLYEEILFQSVGNKLRSRIGRAERWVEEMKELMEARNDSSGLLFSIRWKPRTAETEDELDTKELVELLRLNPRFLKEEDIDKVTKHFRTKIERAKSLMDESTELQTLLQVLKQVLDYRRWFSFELSFQRTGDNRKRPLTDNQFYKFSGGEKARAMYIPLFIATYSRYKEAHHSAPYLISLDEAFAGVDDKNIADLFEVVEELNFNYIINSQVLWGDYPTVSNLAICELFRPQNADHVAVIRYLWDGRKRSLISEQSEAGE